MLIQSIDLSLLTFATRLRQIAPQIKPMYQLNGSLICGVSRAAGRSLGFSGAFSGV